MKPAPGGFFGRLGKALLNSASGLSMAFAQEKAFRQEAYLSLAAFPAAFYFGKSKEEILALALSWAFVMFAELCNTAIEACVDRDGDHRCEQGKKAKDVGSALVLLALVQCAAVWSCIILAR